MKAFLLLLPLLLLNTTADEPAPAALHQPAWGNITADKANPRLLQLAIRTWPADGLLSLPAPMPNFTRAALLQGSSHQLLEWTFNADATSIILTLPVAAPANLPATVLLYASEKTTVFADGHIIFSALDASLHGKPIALESHPGNHRIGFWSNAADWISWECAGGREGQFDVELTYSSAGSEGTEMEFEIAGQKLSFTRPPTGSWYRYRTVSLGRIKLTAGTPFGVSARCSKLTGGAVINLKAISLRPVVEPEKS